MTGWRVEDDRVRWAAMTGWSGRRSPIGVGDDGLVWAIISRLFIGSYFWRVEDDRVKWAAMTG